MTQSDLIKDTLVFEDSQYLQNTLQSLNALRKNKQFCDVVMQVGTYELHAHRAVLACASPYLFDLFTAHSEGTHEFRCKLNGGFDKESFERLMNYAYTARLEVPRDQVKPVYMAANRLKMASVMRECGRYMVGTLKPDNCIGLRCIPGVSSDVELVAKVDAYVQKNVEQVLKSKELLALPRIQVEILQDSRAEMDIMNERQLCNLVVDWIRQRADDDRLTLDQLTEKMHMLYINLDNALHDCNEIQNGDHKDSEIIQDYKKMSLKLQTPIGKGRKKMTPAPSKPRQMLYSRSVSDDETTSVSSEVDEREWKLIAFSNTGAHSQLAIATLGGRLGVVSVLLRLNNHHREPSPVSQIPNMDQHDSYSLLPPMSSARCAVGAAEINGQLLVCGGYDRGECLKTAQMYDPKANVWSKLLPMLHSRGRFDMTVVGDKAFAVGGSDGLKELSSVDCYDSITCKWTRGVPLPMARSNAGVCSLDEKIYCIGGWNGQVGLKRCDVYDPHTSTWTEIASMQIGRYQAGVCSIKGSVFAIGGCNAWNCINVVEKYDPLTNSWNFIAPLHTARRGCGVASYNGKLYAVGGSDGTHSLCSVDILDPETNRWSPGPNLTSCRANVGVAVVDNRLYAVGGFTGKAFLNTIEYLDTQSNEWTTYTLTPHLTNGNSSDTGSSDHGQGDGVTVGEESH